MVHLNGSALPNDNFNPTEFNGTQICLNPKEPPQRRARSAPTARGPKPLLPRSLKEALQLAELLAKSKLIPKGFETPETCLVGILYGMEVGFSPIAALQRMAVIDGRPTIWGDAALALVQASGLLTSIREEIIGNKDIDGEQNIVSSKRSGDGTEDESGNRTAESFIAICTVKREGRSEPVIGTFSVDDAKRAGLWQKPGPWTDYPNRMLTMRARAFALRDAFPDVLAGLYIREEFVEKERQASRSERDRSNDEAEWNAAGALEVNSAIRNNADARVGRQRQPKGQVSDNQKAITSGYDFTPEAHGFSDQRDGNEPPFARRRAPPPPPEGEGDPVPVRIETDAAHEASLREDEDKLLIEGNTLSANEQCERRETLRDEADSINVFRPTDGRINEDGSDAARDQFDPETLFDLLDSALCCAFDLPTFQEIEDDFGERLKPLSKDHRKQAQKIINRHQKRVEDLDRLSRAPNENQNGDELITLELPRGLETALSHLGIGRSGNRARRVGRKERPSHSLSSWNARHRVADRNTSAIDGADETTSSDEHTEAGE